LIIWDREVIGGEHAEIGELPGDDRALLAVLRREPAAPDRVEAERLHAVETIALPVERSTPDGLARDEPVQCDEWVVAGHARGVRAGADRNPELEHPPDGRRPLRLPRA